MKQYRSFFDKVPSTLAILLFASLSFMAIGTALGQLPPIEVKSQNQTINSNFGIVVSGISDINGDGIGDLLVSARGDSPSGSVYVVDGANGSILDELFSSDSRTDAVFFGDSTSGVEDLSGDGIDDIVIGSGFGGAGSSPDGSGAAYVYDGVTRGLVHMINSPNEQPHGEFGKAASGVPDVNGDHFGDIVVGAPDEDVGAIDRGGRVYVFSGVDKSLLHSIVSPNAKMGGNFGIAVEGIPDVNGNGSGDLLVGAQFEATLVNPDTPGRAYVFDGATEQLLHSFVSPGGEPLDNGDFGRTVSSVPDVNGDGIADLVIGAEFEDPGTTPHDAGRAYLFDGSSGALLHTLSAPDEEESDNFPHDLDGVVDLNGDGFGEVVASVSGKSVYVFDGSTGQVIHTFNHSGADGSNTFGWNVAGLSDFHGFVRGNIAIGSHSEGSPIRGGRVFLIQFPDPPSHVEGWSLLE